MVETINNAGDVLLHFSDVISFTAGNVFGIMMAFAIRQCITRKWL